MKAINILTKILNPDYARINRSQSDINYIIDGIKEAKDIEKQLAEKDAEIKRLTKLIQTLTEQYNNDTETLNRPPSDPAHT